MGKGKKKGGGNADDQKQPSQPTSQAQQNQQNQPRQSQPQQNPQNQPKQSQKKEYPSSSKDQPTGKHAEPSTSKATNIDKKNDWICPKCEVSNFHNKKACRNCAEPKQTHGKFVEPPISAGQPAMQQFQPTMPQPAMQQFQPALPQPSMQQSQPQSSKQTDKKNKSDWECAKCNKKNFAKKTTCTKCSEPRPQEPIAEKVVDSASTVQQLPLQHPSAAQGMPLQQQRRPSEQSTSSASGSMPDIQKMQISSEKGIIESNPNGKCYEGKRGRKCTVEVNYVTINFKNLPQKCFHYDVEFLPDTPKKMLAVALHEFMRTFFAGYVYGFDGRKNIYTANKLVVKKNEVDEFSGEVDAHLNDRSRKFKIKVQFAAIIDMSVLLNYQNPIYQNEDKPSTAIQALDVILRSAFRQNINNGTAVQAGRAVYFVPNRNLDLGDGMELWYGLFQSAILGRKQLYLNVDVLHKAFPSSVPLIEYLKTYDRDFRVPQRLNDRQKDTLREFLAMLTIGYQLNNNDPIKTYGFNGLGPEASVAMFDHNNQQMSVQTYFERVKGKRLNFPNLPVLWVGSRTKKVYLPIEFCMIPAGQATNKKCTPNCVRNLIKFSATSTDVRKTKIKELLNKISYERDPNITGFGIQIDKNFQKTEARVINAPQIQYNGSLVQVSRGVWNEGKFLEVAQNRIKWCILNLDDRTETSKLIDFKKTMINEARRQNMFLDDMQANEIQKVSLRDKRISLQTVLTNMKKAGYQLVVVIVNDFDNAYARTKQEAELNVGVLTQCIKSKTLFKMTPATVKNILLKINAKLNGKNHEIVETSYNSQNPGVMFIGADVTHPSPDQRDIPSVVGVASSYDDVGFKYCCAWRLQDPKQEMIIDLENILVEHLKNYERHNKQFPRKIMYYRDGVSDGQFKAVLEIEMTAIRKAIKRIYGLKPPAEVTFIVVQKRHHTRFFPTTRDFSDGRNNNILPGTVIDKDIVHPFQYQFFMASHAAIQGVTKPTKYCILVNESRINPDDLQAITYDLCHLFTRCTRSVSYPAPTYYAHLVAARGKNYIVGHKLQMNNLNREFASRQINPNFVQNSPMFFV